MENFMSLVKSLINEDYTLTQRPKVTNAQRVVYRVTDSKQPDWSCFLVYEDFPEGKKIVLTSGDGCSSKVYEENEWKNVLDDIFFMYHCMRK